MLHSRWLSLPLPTTYLRAGGIHIPSIAHTLHLTKGGRDTGTTGLGDSWMRVFIYVAPAVASRVQSSQDV